MKAIKQAYDEAVSLLTGEGQAFEVATRCFNGVEYKAFAKAPDSLQTVYQEAEQHNDKEFLVYGSERWSVAQVLQQSKQIAAALRVKHAVLKGDRIGIAMRNFPEWMSAFIGITRIGAVAVPINSWGKEKDLLFAARDAGCKTVFCDQQRYELMASGLEKTGIRSVVVRPQPQTGNRQADSESLTQLLEAVDAADCHEPALDGEDLAMIMYTSGTTGKPKGAVSSHRAICQALMNFDCTAAASAMANPELIGKMLEKGYEPVQLLAVPLFHVSGLHAIFLTALRAGRKIVMMYKWNAEQALQLIEQEQVTILSAAPSMLQQLLESPQFDKADTRSLCSLGAGGSATPPRVARLISAKLEHAYPGTGWGMTESNSIGTAFTGQAFIDNPGSAGFCHATVEAKVCDEHGAECAAGETGRIWLKTPTLVNEYWNRTDASTKSFHEGWFDTEDIGYFDTDGYLYLADRAKDMIIRGGENIYPAEVEAELAEHPAVEELAVYGIADQNLGEQVVVSVVPKAGHTLTDGELREFAQQQLAGYKVPARIVIQTEPLPRNAAGKVLKNTLRAAVSQGE